MKLTANFKGQTLVIILLGTSIALTVALAVSVRTISTLRQTTTTAQARAALSAAEAGAETGLQRLASESPADAACKTVSGCSGSGTIAESSTKYDYNVSQVGLGTDGYLIDLLKDKTQEIKLDGYESSSFKVCWYDLGLDGNPEVDNALEIIYVDEAGVLSKYAMNGKLSSSANGFDDASLSAIGSVLVAGQTISFQHCRSLTLTGTPKIMRVKSLYNNVSAAVEPQGGATLPAQAYRVESTGQILDGAVKKKVRVTKSLPALPAIFDFGLYSGSSTVPLSK